MARFRAWREPGHHRLTPGGKKTFGRATLAWLQRRAKRRGYKMTVERVASKRVLMKQWMDWALKNEPSFHYLQRRPMHLAQLKNRELPAYADCSETTTACAYAAGVSDPNGRDYDGTGWTGTIRATLRRIRDLRKLRTGDPIVYGIGDETHVAMVYKPSRLRGNPLMWSHGQEAGPILIRHSIENAAHGGYFTAHDIGAGA